MARAGDEIQNPVTGERIVFLRTAADTSGELLELDDFWTRPGHRAAPHVHPEMEERFEVLSGTAAFRVGGEELTLATGESLTVPPGTPHLGWNPGEEPVHLRLTLRPALHWEDFVTRLFTLAAEGRTDDAGVPEPRLLAGLLAEFSREIAPPPTGWAT